MKNKNRDSFWPSYVDIMTTLFAVMLILFAVSFARFKNKERQMALLLDDYNDIISVYSKVGELDKTKFFDYDSLYLKHSFTVSIAYQEKQYDITNRLQLDAVSKVDADKKRDSVAQAGDMIASTILDLEKENSSKNIKFLIVVEGQSSKIKYGLGEDEWHNNETLSYLRAYHLKKFWMEKSKKLSRLLSEQNRNCEMVIVGSGEEGVPRYSYPEPDSNNGTKAEWKKWIDVEQKNQRFLINIVPVIGNIDMTKAKIEKIRKEH